GDRIVGRADARRSGFDQPLDRVADIGRDDRESGDVTKIIGEGLHAELYVLARLFARVGDMEETDNAPVFAVWRMAIGARRLLVKAPIGGMALHLRRGGAADRQQADTVFAGQQRS